MRLAAIDIGTNSVHMVVVEVHPDLSFEIVDREKEMVRLGSGALESGELTETAMATALETLVRFKQLASTRQVEEILASATSAVREASNGGAFLAEVSARTGIHPRVISGIEEARLVHLAAVYGVDASSGTTVVVDIGGGSTEVTLGTATEVHLARSFKLGVIRLTERFVKSDPISKGEERKLVRHVHHEIAEFAAQLQTAGFNRLIATSGTNLAVGAVALGGRALFKGDSIHHTRVSARAIHNVRQEIVRRNLQRRLRMPGLDSRRSDLLVAGSILLDTIVKALGAEEVVFCDLALREGLILDYIARNRKQIARAERYPDIRRRSVVELGERCRWYPAHSEQVARIALSLFDQTRGLHGLGERAREWLEYAALLHDIGGHIAYTGHHKHSYYLIRNGGLRGFDPEEVEAMALIARYHRRATPHKSHPRMAELPAATRRIVKVASALLRSAESLDRSHAQVVDAVELQDRGDRYALVLHAHAAVELERWAMLRQSRPLTRLLGKPLEIETAGLVDAEHVDDTASVPGPPDRRRGHRRLGKEHATRPAREVARGHRAH